MNEDKLVYMANQIARNFASQGEDLAVAATAGHIRNFWDPRMKQALRPDAPGLCPIASAALASLDN